MEREEGALSVKVTAVTPAAKRRVRQPPTTSRGRPGTGDLIESGKAAFAAGDYVIAVRAWQRARAIVAARGEPTIRLLDAALAEAHFRRGIGGSGASLDDLADAVRLAPDEPRYQYHWALAHHGAAPWTRLSRFTARYWSVDRRTRAQRSTGSRADFRGKQPRKDACGDTCRGGTLTHHRCTCPVQGHLRTARSMPHPPERMPSGRPDRIAVRGPAAAQLLVEACMTSLCLGQPPLLRISTWDPVLAGRAMRHCSATLAGFHECGMQKSGWLRTWPTPASAPHWCCSRRRHDLTRRANSPNHRDDEPTASILRRCSCWLNWAEA